MAQPNPEDPAPAAPPAPDRPSKRQKLALSATDDFADQRKLSWSTEADPAKLHDWSLLLYDKEYFVHANLLLHSSDFFAACFRFNRAAAAGSSLGGRGAGGLSLLSSGPAGSAAASSSSSKAPRPAGPRNNSTDEDGEGSGSAGPDVVGDAGGTGGAAAAGSTAPKAGTDSDLEAGNNVVGVLVMNSVGNDGGIDRTGTGAGTGDGGAAVTSPSSSIALAATARKEKADRPNCNDLTDLIVSACRATTQEIIVGAFECLLDFVYLLPPKASSTDTSSVSAGSVDANEVGGGFLVRRDHCIPIFLMAEALGMPDLFGFIQDAIEIYANSIDMAKILADITKLVSKDSPHYKGLCGVCVPNVIEFFRILLAEVDGARKELLRIRDYDVLAEILSADSLGVAAMDGNVIEFLADFSKVEESDSERPATKSLWPFVRWGADLDAAAQIVFPGPDDPSSATLSVAPLAHLGRWAQGPEVNCPWRWKKRDPVARYSASPAPPKTWNTIQVIVYTDYGMGLSSRQNAAARKHAGKIAVEFDSDRYNRILFKRCGDSRTSEPVSVGHGAIAQLHVCAEIDDENGNANPDASGNFFNFYLRICSSDGIPRDYDCSYVVSLLKYKTSGAVGVEDTKSVRGAKKVDERDVFEVRPSALDPWNRDNWGQNKWIKGCDLPRFISPNGFLCVEVKVDIHSAEDVEIPPEPPVVAEGGDAVAAANADGGA